MIRRGVVVINEEDIARLIKLGPGERVTGVMGDAQVMSILIFIEGGEDLPEHSPGTYPMRVQRPFAMVELRQRLLGLLLYPGSEPGDLAAEMRIILRDELLS